MASEAQYADPDQVWKKSIKEGKPTGFETTNARLLREYAAKFPDFYTAVFGEDDNGGLYERAGRGEEKPKTTVGDWTVGVTYYPDSDSYSIWRIQKKAWTGGSKGQPLLTLEKIYHTSVEQMNALLSQQKAGEIFRFQDVALEDDGSKSVIVLKLRKVE